MSGIDYGMGTTNIDHKAGIRYGVISAYNLAEWFWDEAEAEYGEPTCPECGTEVNTSNVTCSVDFRCSGCNHVFDPNEAYPESPIAWTVDEEGFHAEHTGDSDSDFFVTKSPYYTRAVFCSPCAPGACSLSSPCEDGAKAYCFGHEWFDGGKAPYPVYRVSDDSVVQPKETRQ